MASRGSIGSVRRPRRAVVVSPSSARERRGTRASISAAGLPRCRRRPWASRSTSAWATSRSLGTRIWFRWSRRGPPSRLSLGGVFRLELQLLPRLLSPSPGGLELVAGLGGPAAAGGVQQAAERAHRRGARGPGGHVRVRERPADRELGCLGPAPARRARL